MKYIAYMKFILKYSQES